MAALMLNKRPFFFLVLLLLLTVFTRSSTCSRPLRPAAAAGLNNGSAAAATVQTIALPTAAMSREEGEVVPADKRVEALLDRKPRGRAPPSAPSKRTNDINS